MHLASLLTCQAYKLRSHSANMTSGRISKVLINQAGTGLACISKGKFDFETKIQMINEMATRFSANIEIGKSLPNSRGSNCSCCIHVVCNVSDHSYLSLWKGKQFECACVFTFFLFLNVQKMKASCACKFGPRKVSQSTVRCPKFSTLNGIF